MISASAAYCPNCAALLAFEPGQSHVSCAYCEASLMLDTGRVTHHRASPSAQDRVQGGVQTQDGASDAAEVPIAQPDPSLFVRDAARFRTRIIEQLRGDDGSAPSDLFRTIELDEDRFAIVSLRCTDTDSKPVLIPLEPAWDVLSESLEDDGDPGLAANLALEELASNPAFQRLECVIAVLDPSRTTAKAYCAGSNHAILWVSTEEARPIVAGTNHQPLERADLAKTGSQFDNGRTIQLAAQDLLVVASYGFLNDKGIGSGFPRLMTQALRDHLGEDPQRVVTLIKNEFWEQREKGRSVSAPLAGDLRIAAVGARLADVDDAAIGTAQIDSMKSDHFQFAVQRAPLPPEGPGSSGPVDAVRMWPLSDHRHAALWLQYDESLPADVFETAAAAVHSIFDRTDHGDFDNPRAAALSAYGEIAGQHGLDPARFKMLILHLSDQHQVAKFFTRGWKAPISLGPRGVKTEYEQQQYEERGHTTLTEGSRLFFPGSLAYEGNVIKAEAFAERWHGGKSSHLYESFRLHWRTRKGDKALTKMVRAAAADTSATGAQGLALVTAM